MFHWILFLLCYAYYLYILYDITPMMSLFGACIMGIGIVFLPTYKISFHPELYWWFILLNSLYVNCFILFYHKPGYQTMREWILWILFIGMNYFIVSSVHELVYLRKDD